MTCKTCKTYKCINDKLGGDFAVGTIGTAKQWKKIALKWLESDGVDTTNYFDKGLTESGIIAYIEDIWDITIKEERK